MQLPQVRPDDLTQKPESTGPSEITEMAPPSHFNSLIVEGWFHGISSYSELFNEFIALLALYSATMLVTLWIIGTSESLVAMPDIHKIMTRIAFNQR